MQAIVWFVGLFAAAVALALFAGDNTASVTVFWPPHRVDVSLNLVLLLLFLVFGLLYAAVRAGVGLLTLPRQARRWRVQQQERVTSDRMLEARLQLLAGRYQRAHAAAEAVLARLPEAAPPSQPLGEASTSLAEHRLEALRLLARLTAAEAAQALGNTESQAQHEQAALADAQAQVDSHPLLHEAARLDAARWRLEAQQPEAALAQLQHLAPGAQRRLAARRLRLRAWGQTEQQALAGATLRDLQRHGLLADADGAEGLRGCAEVACVQQLWGMLDESTRARPVLALLAAERLLALGAAPGLARQCLEPLWRTFEQQPQRLDQAHQSRLLHLLELSLSLPQQEEAADRAEAEGDLGPLAWLQRIEAAHQARPEDGLLQALAERASLQRPLW